MSIHLQFGDEREKLQPGKWEHTHSSGSANADTSKEETRRKQEECARVEKLRSKLTINCLDIQNM